MDRAFVDVRSVRNINCGIVMLHTIEFKLYPTSAQAETLKSWLRSCCWIYNRALEHRKKAYARRGDSATLNQQSRMLTEWRSRMDRLQSTPLYFERDALRRVDRGMQAFFRRLRAGWKPGFPRFKSHRRYDSMECLATGQYIRGDCHVFIPKLGLVRFKGQKIVIIKTQKLLRVIRRGSEWFGQVVVEAVGPSRKIEDRGPIGIDVGLASFATLSTGEKIENPRWARKAEVRLRIAQRHLSRCVRGSRNRRKAVNRVRTIHEKVRLQRRNFCHRLSRRLVDSHPIIAVENLNLKGLCRARLRKSVMDAGWAIFLNQLERKAENAGRKVVRVDARYTSQTCPQCGAVKKKSLSERVHRCDCGCVLDRDVAASRVILARAAGPSGSVTPSEESPSTLPEMAAQADPMKKAGEVCQRTVLPNCATTRIPLDRSLLDVQSV